MTITEQFTKLKRDLFQKAYSDTLNEEQREAVFSVNGPVLVLAGAGSGKTTVLVKRIAFILKYGNAYFGSDEGKNITEEDLLGLQYAKEHMTPDEIRNNVLPAFITNPCPPYAILAITFTNKAAKEIQERISRELEDETISKEVVSGTFHSVCARFLRALGEEYGTPPNFTIYDTDDKKHLLQEIMKENGIDEKVLPVKEIGKVISDCKNKMISPDEMHIGFQSKLKEIQKVYIGYQKKLRQYNGLDFDDLLLEMVRILEEYPEVLSKFNKRFNYVCIDEYQDTNPVQFKLAQLISKEKENLMVVGDDDQSIYRFRGATIENILNFDKIYKNCKIITLEQNYRSTKNILSAANAVIQKNTDRHDKELWTSKGDGEKVHIYSAYDQRAEASYIVNTITNLMVKKNYSYKDFAVLFRVNDLSRGIEDAFVKSGMPYRVLSGHKFYERKEIKDILSYLALINNTNDTQRLKRIVNEPKRGIGDKTIALLEAMSEERGISLFECMKVAEEYPAFNRSIGAFLEFTTLIEHFMQFKGTPSELINYVFEKTGYRKMLEANIQDKPRIESVKELVSAAVEYEEREENPTLSGFLESVTLVADVDDYDQESNAVVLMTMHAAKGLEFPVVFTPGWEEDLFPSLQSVSEGGESEERRLAYVTITRAQKELYIIHTRSRLLYGNTRMGIPSRYLKDIPSNLVYEQKGNTSYGLGEFFGGSSFSSNYHSYENHQERVAKTIYQDFDDYSSYNPKAIGELSSKSQKEVKKPTYEKPKEIAPGTRVHHPIFGDGTLLSTKDMGGDLLQEVQFDDQKYGLKKLMATYAKLTVIGG